MILVDPNIWIDHLRSPDAALTEILDGRRQRVHPFVIGEVALGSLRDRPSVIRLLETMPRAHVARDGEVMSLIDRKKLHGPGIGYVDAHSLASAMLMPGSKVWTRDGRLATACGRLGLAFQPLH